MEYYKAKENHSFDIFRKMALLLSDSVHLYDILNFMKIDKVYVYGVGEMGRMALADLTGRIKIMGVYDRLGDGKKVIDIKAHVYTVEPPKNIPNDDAPILITLASQYYEIVECLRQNEIQTSRFMSLNVVLYYGLYFKKQIQLQNKDLWPLASKKEFLITGGQFRNKGSQSMVFTAISEIRKRFRDAIIWFCPNFGKNDYIDTQYECKMIFLADGTGYNSTVYEVLPRIDAIIDVSGYALASRGSINATKRCMDYLRGAYEHSIPIYMMPQSFGPLDYDDMTKKELKRLLSYAEVIFAREKSGYDQMIGTFGLTNVRRSQDLVLQNKGIDYSQIFTNSRMVNDYKLSTINNVAVVPNMQNYRYGNPKEVLNVYICVINKLIALKKNVYIIPHSDDDEICRDIYEPFQDDGRVDLWDKKMNCIEFEKLAQNFQYMIASRFHAIVHSYKKGVPCIALGWAEKYRELLESFQQERYIFDVRERIDINGLLEAVQYMEKFKTKESEKIAEILPRLQTENCFDVLNGLKD